MTSSHHAPGESGDPLWLLVPATVKFTVLWICQAVIVFGLSDAAGVVIGSVIAGIFSTINLAMTLWWSAREKRARDSRDERHRRISRRHRSGDKSTDDFTGKRKHP